MQKLCTTFPVAQIPDQTYWDGWEPDVPTIPVRLTVFKEGIPYGVAAFEFTPRIGDDGVRILDEGDMEFIRGSLISGVRMILSNAGMQEDAVVCAVGAHNYTVPPRAVVDGWVIERASLPLEINSAGIVSAMLSGGPMSIKNLTTGLQYEDIDAPGGEAFSVDLPTGHYRASIWPRDLQYSFTEVDFEIA